MASADLLAEADRAVCHFEWLLKNGSLDDRKDAEPVAALRRYVNSQKNLPAAEANREPTA